MKGNKKFLWRQEIDNKPLYDVRSANEQALLEGGDHPAD